MADEQDLLFREIDEDLKQERLVRLWTSYGKYLIAGALAIVIGVAVTMGWQKYDLGQRQAQGDQFADAIKLIDEDKQNDAINALKSLASRGDIGFGMLARFRAAALNVENNNSDAAIKIYTELSTDTALEKIYRELAIVLGALLEIDAQKSKTKLIERANELAQSFGPWRHNAQEVQALVALRSNKIKTAISIFKDLAKASNAPPGVKARANEMLIITENN